MGTPLCFSQLTCQLASTVGYTLTINKYLIQIHFK